MPKNKKINRKKTIQNILDKCNRSIGFSIDIHGFNEKAKDDKFVVEAAEFCEVEVIHI